MAQSRSPQRNREIVVAYGFDAAGLALPSAIDSSECRIEWVRYDDGEFPSGTIGVIFPSGIFEHVEYRGGVMGNRYAVVSCDRSKLLSVERRVVNLLQAGGWVVVLAREIVDEFASGDGYSTFRSDDTDLTKRLLYGVKRTRHSEGTAAVLPKRDEFAPYIKQCGVARTFFEPHNARILALVGQRIVGFELRASLFVLPFHPRNTSAEHVQDTVQVLVRGVLDYRRKMRVELPDWVSDFQFVAEQKLRDQLSVVREHLLELGSGVKSWEKYEIILVSHDAVLKDALVVILKDFFGLDVDPLDEGREDFKIVDEAKGVIAAGEAKGTNGGIKREHINQVDSHRERLGLDATLPGLLLINNQMDVTGVAKRQDTQVAPEQISHARHLNVLVVRTIDLLYLMRHLEAEPDRRDKFLGILRSGGG